MASATDVIRSFLETNRERGREKESEKERGGGRERERESNRKVISLQHVGGYYGWIPFLCWPPFFILFHTFARTFYAAVTHGQLAISTIYTLVLDSSGDRWFFNCATIFLPLFLTINCVIIPPFIVNFSLIIGNYFTSLYYYIKYSELLINLHDFNMWTVLLMLLMCLWTRIRLVHSFP